DPQLNLGELGGNPRIARGELEHRSSVVSDVLFPLQFNLIRLLQVGRSAPESEQQKLLHQLAVFAQIVFLNLVDIGQVDLGLVLFQQNGLGVRCLEIDQDLGRLAVLI